MAVKIVQGALPKGKLWRTLVLFTTQQEPGLAWQFGLQLASAGNGEAVAAVIVPPAATAETLAHAREVLQQATAYAKNDRVHGLLVEADSYRQALLDLIDKADIDVLLADGDSPEWYDLERLPSAVMVIRGVAYRDVRDEAGAARQANAPIKHILVPTTGGPNAAFALSFLLPLTPGVAMTTLYVVPNYLGENEAAHGKARLRQLLNFADASDRIERKVNQAGTATEGIVAEASGPYDLVIIGASRQSSLDRVLFGDVVGAVVRESKTPVAVVWEPTSTIGNLTRSLAWRLQNVIPRLALNERTEVYVRIRRSARPTTEFFVLIGLSTLIAALGLLLSSPAVVIGAMLVAPLMSPMLGAGLAVVLGNARFLRLAIGAVTKGVLLAIFLGALVGLLRTNQPLTPEILSRTQPTLLDLGVALFAGFAGAYALAHSEAAAALPGVAISAALVPPLGAVGIALATRHWSEALGAMLLFTTNFIAITAAAVLVFVVLGFRPPRAQKERRAMQQRSVRVAMALLVAITLFLGITTFRLAQEASLQSRIHEVTEQHVNELQGVEFAGVEWENLADETRPLTLTVMARATHAILHDEVDNLRNQIGTDLQPYLGSERKLALTMTVIRVTKLDPEVPPTATLTPTPTDTATPGPTPTGTATTTPSPTPTTIPTALMVVLDSPTPSATSTPAPTNTPRPTATPSPTPTPRRAVVSTLYGLNLRAAPDAGSDVLAFLPADTVVILLEGEEATQGRTWQEVSFQGTAGWVAAEFLSEVE